MQTFSRFSRLSILAAILAAGAAHGERSEEAEVCVYAATPSGILAAVAVKREGRSVVIVEPSRWVGGVLGAGLKPMQDCPNYTATGGLTQKLLQTLGHPAWDGSGPWDGSPALKRMSPKEVREDFEALLKKWEVRVIRDHRVARCEKSGAVIAAAVFDRAPFDALGCPVAEPAERGALRVSAKIFIDASYEGDLMAKAGVSYRVGRESAAEFGEPYAGVQPPMEEAPIDPFVVPGKPESGLLKWVEQDHGLPIGAADGYTQAYNYRYYTTSEPAYRAPFNPEGRPPRISLTHGGEQKSKGEAGDFELVGRYVAWLTETVKDQNELRRRLAGIFPGWMNAGEWNYQRASLFTMAPVGVSQRYADGDDAERARVWKLHQDYLRGLHAFMSGDPRVPEWYRKEVAEIGLDVRHHPETQGWPHQLYVRVARRMAGRYIITTHDVYNRTTVDDPVCLAQYGIDTYPARRIWYERDGKVWVGLEGKMFVGGSRGPTRVPYPIPYRALTPKAAECANLLVSVSFSATHLGYASARMEPVFMMCGESAGIAACRALAEGKTVQEIDSATFRAALEKAGQKLVWDPAKDVAPEARASFSYAALLNACDANGDGTVTRSEWEAGKREHAWAFRLIDRDGDGKISAAEYAAFQAYKAKSPDWAKRK
ncbi:MAG TPA: FAD-dependent oxidoreductase [Kiritimatiellia bacterium]|nr:FAD-dependent oxidoreductase [Kiritimatiellia bacterium]HRU70017.1 FAD-dependent oxidoreductase [Kiritimatiellia bacterium]